MLSSQDEKTSSFTSLLLPVPPAGYEAVVLQAGRGDGLSEAEERSLRAVAKTDRITHWNYDKVPDQHDGVKRALKWADYAEVMNGDSDAEAEEKENKN